MAHVERENRVRPWHRDGRTLFFTGTTIASAGYLIGALRLPLGTVDRAGPGFFPVLVAAIGLLASITAIIGARTDAHRDDIRSSGDEAFEHNNAPADRLKPAAFLLIVLIYPLVVGTVGHLIAAALVCAGVLLLARQRSVVSAVVWAVVFAVASSYLFQSLDVQLPQGPLGI